MARAKTQALKKAASKTPAGKMAKTATSAVKGLLGMKSKGGKKRRKHSLSWYIKETARLKAKKRYEKVRLGAN